MCTARSPRPLRLWISRQDDESVSRQRHARSVRIAELPRSIRHHATAISGNVLVREVVIEIAVKDLIPRSRVREVYEITLLHALVETGNDGDIISLTLYPTMHCNRSIVIVNLRNAYAIAVQRGTSPP